LLKRTGIFYEAGFENVGDPGIREEKNKKIHSIFQHIANRLRLGRKTAVN
jgi:hypothetical protein